VRDQTRTKVLEAAQHLGYQPDGPARTLRTGRSRTLALCVPFITNPTIAAIIQGASRCAHAAGYVLTIAALENDVSLERSHLDLLLRQRVAAVITLAAGDDPAAYLPIQESGVPVVFVDRRPPDIVADFITPDHEAGTREAVQHLLATGRRRIALLAGPLTIGSSLARAAGYQAAHAAAGMPTPAGLIRYGLRTSGDAGAATAELLDADEAPDAVVAGNASLTLGALACLRDRHRQIPDEVALVGAGDVEWARLVEPPLSMIEVQADDLGFRAARMALDRLDPISAGVPARLEFLPATLVIRGSSLARVNTAPPIDSARTGV